MTFPAEHPANTEELAAFLEANSAGEQRPVIPVGGGTWLDFGRAVPAGVELHTSRVDQVRDYPARDMTITVEAGLPVGKLSELLAKERQQVPVDFPQHQSATIGGVIAANVSGPRRFGYGTLRDYLIGVQAVDAGGRVFHAGGRVVKNVAGYDLCKLMVGSWGTLAAISEVTLKVVPIPETSAWVWSTWESPQKLDQALGELLTSNARPVAVEVLNQTAANEILKSARQDWPASSLVLALMVVGSKTDADWQMEKLRDELKPYRPGQCEVVPANDSVELLQALTDFPIQTSPFSFQANLLPSKTIGFVEAGSQAGFSIQAHAGNGVVIGHASDDIWAIERAQEKLVSLRSLAESSGGSLVIQNCPSEWKAEIDAFGSPKIAWGLMKDLKKSLDPLNLLCPNRLFAWE